MHGRGNPFYEVVCQASVIPLLPETILVLWSGAERSAPNSNGHISNCCGRLPALETELNAYHRCPLFRRIEIRLLMVRSRPLLALGPPSIRARSCAGSPDSECASSAGRAFEERPHLRGESSSRLEPQGFHGPVPPFSLRFCSDGRSSVLHPGQRSYVLVSAPSGNAPVSRYFQNSTASFRASATIPMRRRRLPPCAYFS